MKGKIIVVGSLNMDLIIETGRMPGAGETLTGWGFATAPGGKGANQAVAAARLGGETHMLGCVGTDLFGQDICASLDKNGVHTRRIRVADGPTGVAMIVLCQRDNRILLESGANNTWDIPMLADDLKHICRPGDVLITQLEIPKEVTLFALRTARQLGAVTVLNPAPAQTCEELYPYVDYLIPNETECASLSGITPDSQEEQERAVGYFRDKGVKTPIITLGGRGVVYSAASGIKRQKACEVAVVDTTAAGDAFVGGLGYCLAQGMDMDETMKLCVAAAALTVTKKGSQAALPAREEVKEMLRSQPK